MPGSHYYGLILAGGRGTRFWPRSRRRSAKQVLNVVGERSLIQATVDRLAPLIAPERLWVLTNDHLRDEIVRQFPEIPPRQILAEPEQRNTAPAIGLAAHILQSLDPEAVMGVFPADHVIAKAGRFRQFLRCALRAAGRGRMVVLGIQPRWAETGYGYIEFPKGTAAGKLATRRHPPVPRKARPRRPPGATLPPGTSIGMPACSSGARTSCSTPCAGICRRRPRCWPPCPRFADAHFPARLEQVFPLCENISIDYAVLERAQDVVGIPCDDIGWNDVGSWNAVYELLPRDSDGNALGREMICEASSGNFVDARGKLVALLGVDDLMIVDTPDALLIADRNRAQDVGSIVKILEKRKREDLL